MSASKNINAEKIQGNLNVNGLSATTVNVNDNYYLPDTAGIDGQVLSIDGGAVVWSSVTKTILNVSIGTNDQIPFMNSTPNDFDYSSDLIFDGNKLRVSSSTNYVNIFDSGSIELFGTDWGMSIGGTTTGSKIQSNLHNSDLSIYSNNDKQLYLKYNNPYVGINNSAPDANLHVKSTSVGQVPFLVENSSGNKLFEITSDNLVKISDAYTLPNNSPMNGNVIIADSSGGSSWDEYPLEYRWTSDEGTGGYSNGYKNGRITSNEFRFIELNISASTNPNIIHGTTPIIGGLLTMGSDNNFGNNGGLTNTSSLYYALTVGTGNTIGQYRIHTGVCIGDDNNISSYNGWPTSINSSTNFKYNSLGYPSGSYTSGIVSHDTSNHFIMGDNNYLSGKYNFSSGSNNLLFVESVNVLGSNVTGFTSPGDGYIYNITNTHILGDNIRASWSNQILIGRGFSTENTNNRSGLYFGWSTMGTTKPSMGLVGNSDGNFAQNFAMGGVDVFTSGATTGIFHEGAGSGNFFLYRDASTVEPYDIIPNTVALFAKKSSRGVTGLAIKAEDETYSTFTDTVSIGLTGGTAMLEVKSNGDSDTTDMLKVKNSNDEIGIQITDGLNVYMPNLPITPGGLSAGGLYIDTATDTIKVAT